MVKNMMLPQSVLTLRSLLKNFCIGNIKDAHQIQGLKLGRGNSISILHIVI